MKRSLFLLAVLPALSLSAQELLPPEATEFYTPVPPKVESAAVTTPPPSDAIVLFGPDSDGSEFVGQDGKPNEWTITDGVMTVNPGAGGLWTRRKFGDVQLHVEWRSPVEADKEGQHRGNSGVFLQGRYEVQVLESNGGVSYTNGQAASIYKQSAPLVNATQPMNEWNSYDIIYRAPVFGKTGAVVSPAYITVLHNGVLVQNHFELKGPTEYRGIPHYKAHGEAPIHLQDHSNLVSYRNIWVREL